MFSFQKTTGKRKGGFLFFASCCIWAWPLGQPQRRFLNLHQFFEPNSCGVLVLHGQQQYMTLTPPQNEQNEPEEGPSKKENLLQNTNLYFSGPMLNFGGVTKRGMVHDCG